MSITLNEKSKASIEKTTGIKVSDLIRMGVDEIDASIENKIGKKLKFHTNWKNIIIGRGSVYLFLNRLIKLEFINKKLSKI